MSLKRLYVLFLLAILPAMLLPSTASASTWREIQSPHFRVITNGSDRDGQAVAKEFEQMRYIFATRFTGGTLENGAPLRIFAIREDALHDMGPYFWKNRDHLAGEFISGWENQYAIVRLDTFGDLNQAVIFHEYTHSFLHANFHWLPHWLDEGEAEFYGYTRFQGDRTLLGAPSVRYRALKQGPLIPTSEMLTAEPWSFLKDQQRSQLFYAEAWAMVHYMTFGEGMEGGTKLNRLLSAIETGTPQLTAFQQIFGDTKHFDEGLSMYLNRLSTLAAVLPPAPGVDSKTFTSTILSPARVDYEIGTIDGKIGDQLDSRKRLESSLAAEPNLGPAQEELGFLDFKEGRDNDAQECWKKAVTLDPNLYRSSFALLMTAQPHNPSPDQLRETQAALERINNLAPKYAPAFVELALTDWRLGKLQDAYKASRTAEQLAPWRAGYHLLTANLLLQGKQPTIAASYSRTVAEQWPGTDHNEAVVLWDRLPPASRGDGPPLTMSFPEGDTVVYGKVVSTACDKGPDQRRLEVTLQPAAGAAPLTLVPDGRFESGFSDTLWFGEDHYNVCHHLEGLPALAAYTSTPSGNKLTVFQVFDNLPGAEPLHLPEPNTAVAAPAHP